jgi:hypothetical protein
MKDYLDLDLLLGESEINQHRLAIALKRTFTRRKTPLPDGLPLGLSQEFWTDPYTQRRWQAFVTKNRLSVGSLEDVCRRVGQRIAPPLQEALSAKDI